MNEITLAKYRKYQSNLIIGGLAVIFFALWSALKYALIFVFAREQFDRFIDYASATTPEYRQLVIITMIVILAIDLFIRILIGLSILKNGKHFKASLFTIIGLAIALVLSATNLGTYLDSTSFEFSRVDTIVTFILEATSLFNITEVFFSYVAIYIMVKKEGVIE
ncbi:MAG: hypothetical protein KBS96_03100 [Lachnospiraceae bacterium]|nr:hypothetical protein [Candidatus Colinaster scatohippi]